MTSGELPISLGSATDPDKLKEYADQALMYAMLLNNDTMPIKYDMGETNNVVGSQQEIGTYFIYGIIIGVCAIIAVYMIIKFKADGLFATFSIVLSIALLLLAARYTDTEISINSGFAIAILMIMNAYLIYKTLNNIKKNSSYENVKRTTIRTYIENIEVIVTSIIIAIVFTFMQYDKVFSFGMTLFYGIISVAIANFVFLRTMLLAKYEE